MLYFIYYSNEVVLIAKLCAFLLMKRAVVKVFSFPRGRGSLCFGFGGGVDGC